MYVKKHEVTTRPVKLDITISLCTEYNGLLYVNCGVFPIMIAITLFSFSLITRGSSFNFVH